MPIQLCWVISKEVVASKLPESGTWKEHNSAAQRHTS
jgi:hypothetical protein